MEVRKIVSSLGGTSEKHEELLLRAAWSLLRVDPLLMGKVVRTYAENVCLPQFGITSTRKILSSLLAAFSGSTQSVNIALQKKKNTLLEDISNTMGYLDTNFIRRGLIEPALSTLEGKVLKELEENNLALSLHIESFRRLLGIYVLEKILQTIGLGK